MANGAKYSIHQTPFTSHESFYFVNIQADMDLNELKGVLVNPHSLVEMKFLLQEQKYLECLEDGRVFEALDVLRKELTPLGHNVSRVHQLSGFMMCSNDDELRKAAHWQGKGQVSRGALMERLQRFLPPSIMLPPRRYPPLSCIISTLSIVFTFLNHKHRLHTLLSQAVDSQKEKCRYHVEPYDKNPKTNSPFDNVSMLTDHICSKYCL